MENIEYYSISDSFKVALLPIPISTVSIGIAVPVGALHENRDEYGIAHLLEHMVFAGTKTRTNEQIDREIESLGASMNAYTNYTETVYYVHGNGKFSHKLLDIILDIFVNSVYPESGVKREKAVVKEEIKAMYENSAGFASHLQAIDMLFEGVNERLRHLIGGYDQEIDKYTRQSIVDFRTKNYKTAYLIMTGSFDLNKTLNALERMFGTIIKPWKRPTVKPNGKLEIPFYGNLGKRVQIPNDTTQSHVKFCFRSMPDNSRWTTHVGIISYILTGNLNSMLSRVLRKELNAVYSVDSYQKTYKDAGYFSITFTCNKDMVELCVDAVWKVLDQLKEGRIDPEYLNVVKNLRETRNLFVFENYENYFDIVVESVLTHSPLPTPKKIMNRIKKVDLSELKGMCKKMFQKDNSLLIIEG
jgi:predicted Zn-dependent peptidase